MNTFFDTSAFAKRYVLEAGSDKVEDICMASTSMGLCIICIPEIISAFNHKLREKSISRNDYDMMKNRLNAEIKDAIILNITPAVVQKSISLLELNRLRAMDALHIACAIEWNTDLFVSADHRQIKAAKNYGLKIKQV